MKAPSLASDTTVLTEEFSFFSERFFKNHSLNEKGLNPAHTTCDSLNLLLEDVKNNL